MPREQAATVSPEALRRTSEGHQYAVPIFQGYISDDHEDDHPVYIKRNSVLHLALFVPWENFISESLALGQSIGGRRVDDTIDVEYPLDDGRYEEESPALAHRQAYRALLQILRNAVQDTDATKDSTVLGGLIHDLCEENLTEEEQPFTTLSGSQGTMLSADGADIDDTLARYGDTEPTIAPPGSDLNQQGPRMLVDAMALQLVCAFLDRYTANQDSAGQHLQYTGGPGGTGKSRIIDALKDVFAARNQPHLLQITGTSGSSAAQIGGTTIHSACGLDSHRDPNKPPPPFRPFSEAKKWIWKQKLVLVIDEVSMLGGATLHNVSRHLQVLRDCPDEPFGGMPVVLLMGDYQFARAKQAY
ncbi:PIF1-like helicase [Hirsutella rhossiliensis]